jgi:hypothetical protein
MAAQAQKKQGDQGKLSYHGATLSLISGRVFIGADLYGTQLVIIVQDMGKSHHPESATPRLNGVVAVQGHDLLLDGLIEPRAVRALLVSELFLFRQRPISVG